MKLEAEFIHGPAGAAAWDQKHAEALEALRSCDGFFLIASHRKGDDRHQITSLACGTDWVDVAACLLHAAEDGERMLAGLRASLLGED